MTKVKLTTLLTLCSFLLYARQIHGAANIDTIQLIVRYSPDREAEDDYGYAVTLHQTKIPTEGEFVDALDSTKIIVGAPKGTYPGGLNLPPANSAVSTTGLVYTCPVNRGTGCMGLMGNPIFENDRRLFDGEPNGVVFGRGTREEAEYKSGQLMGATLESAGGYFLACAPRYQTNGTFRLLDSRKPVGKCFISGRELENFVDYRPCLGGDSNIVQSGGDSECLTGIGAELYVDENNRTLAALGAVGDNQFRGKTFLYDVTDGNNTLLADDTSPFSTYVYEGYSVSSGRITGATSPDFLIGVPRFNGSFYSGSVFVRNRDTFTNTQMDYNLVGDEIGEYYGWSVATADLNNDGFDEILVGAPVYSSQSEAEIGRVYVYENNRDGTVANPIHLKGQSANSRFGTSIVNLGDVNGDGFHDVAIGAPYHNAPDTDNTGAVYIYYGNMNGQIISTTPDQIINASSVVNRVDGLIELRSFGYSLSSGVDVDNNAYNDLLVGAYESKTVVLLRTLSIAHITVRTSVIGDDTISIEDAAMNGADFMLSVCASYNGRGLTGRSLDTTLVVREDGTFNRLTFGGGLEYRNTFNFVTTNNETCQTVTVTIKPLSQQPANVDVTTPYEVIVDFAQFERPLNPTDGNEVLADLRNIPLLVVDGDRTAMVTPFISCARGTSVSRCEADLELSFAGIEYKESEAGAPLANVDSVVAGQVQYVDIRLRYINTGLDPAIGTFLNFDIPEPFARQATVRFDDQFRTNAAECISDGRNFDCSLDNYLAIGQSSTVVVQLNLNVQLVGNEDPVTFSASVRVNPVDTDDIDITNNIIEPVTIRFSAVADLLISDIVMTGPMDYASTMTGMEGTVGNLGRRVNLRTSVTNSGPSTNPLAELRISFPVGSSSVGPHFYVYNIDSTVRCAPDGFDLNREGLDFSSGRRRRAAQLFKRQEAQVQAFQTNVDCSDPVTRATNSCANVLCQITDFTARTFIVNINGVVDRRFFDTQSETFTYTSYASVTSLTDFISDPNSGNNRNEMVFSLGPEMSDGGRFPVWIPIVCALAALILIIILFVLLYFFGFFRRKRVKEEQAEGNVAVQEVPPEGQSAVVGGALAPIDEKGDDVYNEIGDASDLHDGEVGESTKEADETSL